MFWTIIIALVALWLLGFGFRIGGKIIHVLLILALVAFIVHLLF